MQCLAGCVFITLDVDRNYDECLVCQETPYLVSRQQQSQPRPEAGTVQQQGRAKVSGQTILADPRDVVGLRLLLQTAFHHVPPQKALRGHTQMIHSAMSF